MNIYIFIIYILMFIFANTQFLLILIFYRCEICQSSPTLFFSKFSRSGRPCRSGWSFQIFLPKFVARFWNSRPELRDFDKIQFSALLIFNIYNLISLKINRLPLKKETTDLPRFFTLKNFLVKHQSHTHRKTRKIHHHVDDVVFLRMTE